MDELAERIGALSPDRRRLLEQRLAAKAESGAGSAPAVQPRGGGGPAPLSFVQEAIWAVDRLDPGTPIFNVPAHLRLSGPLDTTQLYWGLISVVERQEVLSSTFRQDGQTPVSAVVKVANVDLRRLDGDAQQRQLDRLAGEHAAHRFDLPSGPPVIATLATLAEEQHVLLLTLHHMVTDAWSIGLLARDLGEHCASFVSQRPALVPDLPVQFADYAAWQWRQPEVRQQQEAAWRRRLVGAVPFGLPHDAASGSGVRETGFVGAAEPVRLGSDLTRALCDAARTLGVTPFSAVLSGLLYSLMRITGQPPIVRCPVANRDAAEVQELIGPFASPVLLGWPRSRADTFASLLGAVHADALEVLDRPYMPGDCNALSSVMFDLRKQTLARRQVGDLLIEPLDEHLGVASTGGLELFVEMSDGDELAGVAGYDTRTLSAGTVREVTAVLQEVLRFGAADPDRPLDELVLQGSRPLVVQPRPAVAIAGSFTAEPIERPLSAWLQRLGIDAPIRLAPFGPLPPLLLAAGSPLRDEGAGLRVLLLRADDALGSVPGQQQRNLDELLVAVGEAAAAGRSPLLAIVCPGDDRAGLQEQLLNGLEALPGVRLVRPLQLLVRYHLASGGSQIGDREGGVPYGPDLYAAAATEVARLLFMLARPALKAIAVDCDGVLWGGACGEDGPEGVTLEDPHLALQRMLLEQHSSGRLLCLVSRNAPEDVAATFAAHPDMPLRLEHIAAQRIGWEPKFAGLQAVARELGFAPESVLFLDDDPVEVARVHQACPDVLSLALPADTWEWPAFLEHLWPLDLVAVTDEDRRRGERYRVEGQRRQERAASASLEAFFARLDLEVEIQPARMEQLERLAQLSARTTQFNTTGRALTVDALRAGEALAVSVRDRYGDYGLVGAVSLRGLSQRLVVEHLSLSCRALGRGVEHRVLSHLGQRAGRSGASELEVRFAPTRRNGPAAAFLEAIGGVRTDAGYRFEAAEAATLRFSPATAAVTETDAAPEPVAAGIAVPSEILAEIAGGLRTGRSIRQAIDGWLRRPRPPLLGPPEAPRTDLEQKLAELCAGAGLRRHSGRLLRPGWGFAAGGAAAGAHQ